MLPGRDGPVLLGLPGLLPVDGLAEVVVLRVDEEHERLPGLTTDGLGWN